MRTSILRKHKFLVFVGLMLFVSSALTSPLISTLKVVKPSIVGIGLHSPLSANSLQLQGSGFVIGNGQYIATNYHVIAEPLDENVVQHRVVMAGTGRKPKVFKAEIVDSDAVHDLAILRIEGSLTPMRLADDAYIEEASELAFTGFPIGAVLGLYPATHKAMLAAISPDSTPAINSDTLSINLLNRLNKPFLIYQLDGTAYPGNSGSAVYRVEDGVVVAVINKVFIAQGKESALSTPSGISYAIPIRYLRALAKKNNIKI